MGRAGRGKKKGRSLIQAYNTDAYAVELGVRQDYEAFYNMEISLRRNLEYPPFGTIVKILFTSVMDAEARKWAEKAMAVLEKNGVMVSEVQYAPVSRINRKYRYRIVARSTDAENLRKKINEMYLWIVAKKPAGVVCSIDVKGDRVL